MEERYVDVFDVRLGVPELAALEELRSDLSRGVPPDVGVEPKLATVSEFEAKAAFLVWCGLLRLEAPGAAPEAMQAFKARLGGHETPEVAAAWELGLVLWLRRAAWPERISEDLARWLATLDLDDGVHRRVVDTYLDASG